MEERIARLEGRTEEISKRIDDLRNDMNHRFSEISKRIDDLRGDMNHRFSHMEWEVRVWFIVLIVLITILTFLKP